MKIKLSKIDTTLLAFCQESLTNIRFLDKLMISKYGLPVVNKALRLGLIMKHLGSAYMFTTTCRLYLQHPDIPTAWLLNTKAWHSGIALSKKMQTLDTNRFFDHDDDAIVLMDNMSIAARVELYHRQGVPGRTYLTLHTVVDIQLAHFKKFKKTPSVEQVYEAIHAAGYSRIKHSARLNEGYIIKD